MAKPATRTLLVIGVTVVVGMILLVLVIVYGVRDSERQDCDTAQQQNYIGDEKLDLLSHYQLHDGLNLKIYPIVRPGTIRQEIDKAIADNYHMVAVDVITQKQNVASGLTIVDILTFLKESTIGVMLHIGTNSAVEKVLNSIQQSDFKSPVIFSIPLLAKTSDSINISRLQQDMNYSGLSSQIGVNFDLRSLCCQPLGFGTIEHISSMLNSFNNFQTTVEVDPSNVGNSWDNLRWLLEINTYVSLIMSSKQSGLDNSTYYKMLQARNDIDVKKLFYNMDTQTNNSFEELASTAGSALHYFDIYPRDAGAVIWSHNTDTWDLLNMALTGKTMMIEGDIMLKGQGTINQTNTAIMAHDAGDDNNITFQQWLDEIIKVRKGIKLDFKYIEAVEIVMTKIASRGSDIKGPIWANADIMKGPGAASPRITPVDFIKALKPFPQVTLSLGWTTIQKGQNISLAYTMTMVKEMYEFIKDLPQPITFPVRAEQLKYSWDVFDWLLQKSRGYTLTVWTGYGDNVTKDDMDFIKKKAEMSRVYFDLPEELRPSA